MPRVFLIKTTAGFQYFGSYLSLNQYRKYIIHVKEYLENGGFYFVGSLKNKKGK